MLIEILRLAFLGETKLVFIVQLLSFYSVLLCNITTKEMHDLRVKLQAVILSWPNATAKRVYGCPCYKNSDKLFAFLVTDGVVLTKVE